MNETFHDESTDVIENYCGVPGLTVESHVVVDGRTLTHAGQPGPKFMELTGGTFVDTNVANGKSISGTFRNTLRALDGTDNGDGTLTVLFLQTGNNVTFGSDGQAIARDPGQIRFELLIDHNGTPDDPSDDEVIDFVRLVKDSTGRNDDFCAAAVPAIS